MPFLFALIIPMLYPFLVPLGLHWPLNALILMNIQTLGYDFVQGPMGVWNFACFSCHRQRARAGRTRQGFGHAADRGGGVASRDCWVAFRN